MDNHQPGGRGGFSDVADGVRLIGSVACRFSRFEALNGFAGYYFELARDAGEVFLGAGFMRAGIEHAAALERQPIPLELSGQLQWAEDAQLT